MRIAIIGSGIAGLTAAHRLQDRHDVTIFEAGAYAGGHTHTVDVEIDGTAWSRVENLSGFSAADRVYAVSYADGGNAPELLFPPATHGEALYYPFKSVTAEIRAWTARRRAAVSLSRLAKATSAKTTPCTYSSSGSVTAQRTPP